MNTRHLLKACLLLFLICGSLYAAPSFPPLTGQVVDEAHVLSPETIEKLNTLLADYEQGTTNQVVVLTVPTLQNYPIEEYGYQLGRHWGVGQKGKNNGVILIVAPKERKVRIEVGYGLEPILTDALSSSIIQGIILPHFRTGHLEQGVIEGTQAITNVLGGKPITFKKPDNETSVPIWLVVILIFLFLWFVIRHPYLAAIILNSGLGNGRGGDDDGGGFSGGGGSFGGGGASGSW